MPLLYDRKEIYLSLSLQYVVVFNVLGGKYDSVVRVEIDVSKFWSDVIILSKKVVRVDVMQSVIFSRLSEA